MPYLPHCVIRFPKKLKGQLATTHSNIEIGQFRKHYMKEIGKSSF